MSTPIETTLETLIQEAATLARRAIIEDYPDLVVDSYSLVLLASRLAGSFGIEPPVDPDSYIANLKKRFVLSTHLKVVAGIFPENAIAVPLDTIPLRRGSIYRLGVGLEEDQSEKIAVDAPCYHPDEPCFGIVIPGNPDQKDEWYIIREKGEVSYVMLLEHEWISGYGANMVVVKQVLGVGSDATLMAQDTCPDIGEWIDRARALFHDRYITLIPDSYTHGIKGFYHFGKGGFCRHPWDTVYRWS